jgi:16S rRNA (cytosine1402-N4)-methyltransferase
VNGLLADLGVSSPQLDRPERGFSFRFEGPLDMRMDPTRGTPASILIAELTEPDLADLFHRYGEERHSRRIARAIVEDRRKKPFRTTTDLADLIRRVVPRSADTARIDPATRVFQALRIVVNDELGALETLLDDLPGVIAAGGRAAIIAFHSLEDRLVKNAFRERSIWLPTTKKPITAGPDEERENPRSRSAKLRVAVRIGPDHPGPTRSPA